MIVEPLLLRNRVVEGPRAEPARRMARRFGMTIPANRARHKLAAAFRDVSDHFHADPAAGKPRHRDPVQAELDEFLGA